MYKQLKLGIILNPAAGRGRAGKNRKRLISYLQERKIPFQLETTRGSEDASVIASQMSNHFKTIVAAGGDGTVSEIVSGVIGKGTSIAILPIGSGNDFSKTIGIPKKIQCAIDTIIHGNTQLFDLGKVSYWNQCDEKKERYFINTLGLGLDAEIASETKQMKYLRGLPLYLLAAIKAVYKHSQNEYKISEGRKIRIERAFFICTGNGCFEGGGFKLLPDASPNDSQLDVCVLRNMSVSRAFSIVPKLIKGSHGNLEKIGMWKTKRMQIEGKNTFFLHADGEILETKTMCAKIELASQKINFIVPDGR
jgi:diacylglycerol kinase (ATP)